MAQVTFIDGIASISGKLDGIIYRRTASGKTIAYECLKHEDEKLAAGFATTSRPLWHIGGIHVPHL